MSFLPSIVALSMMAAVAVYLTITRGGIRADATALRHGAYVALLATVLQVGHVLEEAGMGLNRRFPEFFGLAPVPMEVVRGYQRCRARDLAAFSVRAGNGGIGGPVSSVVPRRGVRRECLPPIPRCRLPRGATFRDCSHRQLWVAPAFCFSAVSSVLLAQGQ